jgi:hypothetical protein
MAQSCSLMAALRNTDEGPTSIGLSKDAPTRLNTKPA